MEDTTEEKQLFDYLKPTSQEDRNKRFIMSGATPLLVGLLSGNMGDAADIAGQALLDEDRRQLKEDSDLMTYLMKKKTTSDNKLYKIRDPKTGDIKYGTHEQALGSLAPHLRRPETEEISIAEGKSKVRKKEYTDLGKDIQVVEDPISGEKVMVSKKTKKVVAKPMEIPKEYPQGWTKTKEDLTQKTVKDFNSVVKKHDEAITSLDKAERSLANGGQFAEKLGVMQLVKDVETRLSDYDRTFYINQLGYIRSFMDKLKREKTGRLPSYIVKEAKELIANAKRATSSHILKQRDRRVRQLKAAGIPSDYATSRFGLKESQGISFPKGGTVRVSNGKETYDINPKDLKDAQKDGFKVVE